LRICYLADATSIHTRRWAEHFARRGDEVHVITFRPHPIDDVTVHCFEVQGYGVAAKLSFFLTEWWPVRKLIWRLRPDVLHAHKVTGYGPFGVLSGYHPFFVTAWGSDVLVQPQESLIFKFIVRYVLGRADVVTSMANHMTGRLIELGAREDRIILLPFGIDPQRFNLGLREVFRKEEGEGPLIVCTTYLNPVHNVGLLVRAAPLVLDELPQAQFVIIGSGTQEEELKQLATELGVADRVLFLGFVEHEQVPRYLACCDVFASPALSHGNNIALNEAMACGAFPVTTDIPANREWIEDGQNGYLVPVDAPALFAQRIVAAIRSPELWRRAQELNQEIVHRRAVWHKNIERMEAVYAQLAQGG